MKDHATSSPLARQQLIAAQSLRDLAGIYTRQPILANTDVSPHIPQGRMHTQAHLAAPFTTRCGEVYHERLPAMTTHTFSTRICGLSVRVKKFPNAWCSYEHSANQVVDASSATDKSSRRFRYSNGCYSLREELL